MPYLLRHYFDPGFDHRRLQPTERSDGSVDHRALNYVQNVIQDQVLAAWEDLDAAEQGPGCPPHCEVFETKDFPAGPGTVVDPEDPDRLLAERGGYVYYADDGRITVKEELNIRGDVDYSTGDIAFVGDVVVHGQVRTGFTVSARRVTVHGQVEGAEVRALRRIECPGGIKGGGRALLEAGTNLRAAFCENAVLKAKRHVAVDTNCLHSRVFARGRLAVQGRITGGEYHFYEGCDVGERLGGGMNAATSLVGGYDPELVWLDRRAEARAEGLREEQADLEALVERGAELAEEYGPRLEQVRARLKRVEAGRVALWERSEATARFDGCRVRVRGRVLPGVEISIGKAYLCVAEELENVTFAYDDCAIVVDP
mgnify:CR=1 FL=1